MTKEYYEKNKQKIIDNVRKHRQKPEYRKKQIEWNEKWRAENIEKVRAYKRKSQAKRNAVLREIGYVTVGLKEVVFARDNYACLSCGTRSKLTVDHITPISKGGVTEVTNLQTLCVSCNSSKQQQVVDYRITV